MDPAIRGWIIETSLRQLRQRVWGWHATELLQILLSESAGRGYCSCENTILLVALVSSST